MHDFSKNSFYPFLSLSLPDVKEEMNRVPSRKCEEMLMGGGVNPYFSAQ
jgi:hypothetical protein